MATYLKLCQDLARESGTVSTTMSTVSGQTGWLADVIGWVADAWVDIQNAHESWLFLRKEFSSALVVDNGSYTASSFGIENFGAWRVDPTRLDTVTIYDPDIGVSDEGALRHLDWDDFKRRFLRGEQTSNKPEYWSVSPDSRFCVGPAPDKAYTVNGEYIRAPQVLEGDDDVPICPERFHNIIRWYALLYLVEGDSQDPIDIVSARRKYDRLNSDLEHSQLPRLRLAGPLA